MLMPSVGTLPEAACQARNWKRLVAEHRDAGFKQHETVGDGLGIFGDERALLGGARNWQ